MWRAPYLIRGARRLDGVFYPNPETGYGLLDLYGIFQKTDFILRL